MSLSTPKTGLAGRLRDWMSARTGNKKERRFTILDVCQAMKIMPGDGRQKVAMTLYDFVRRGELIGYKSKKYNRRQYLYVQDWRKVLRGKINRKIFKAMYVSHDFSVTDIQRLTDEAKRDSIDKIVRSLKKDRYIQQIMRRRCAHGVGVENIYHIVNRDRFKLELMKGDSNA